MTRTATITAEIPTWSLGWRLQRALQHADYSVGDISKLLGISRATASRWMHDEIKPRPAFIMAWAIQCGVDQNWLEHGENSLGDQEIRPTGWTCASRSQSQFLQGEQHAPPFVRAVARRAQGHRTLTKKDQRDGQLRVVA